MIPALEIHRSEIARLCGRYGVRRLDVFGSASVEVEDAAARDIDLIVDFDRDSRQRPLPCYFEFKSDLESLLGKPVDLDELARGCASLDQDEAYRAAIADAPALLQAPEGLLWELPEC